jgi:hypothetical protein
VEHSVFLGESFRGAACNVSGRRKPVKVAVFRPGHHAVAGFIEQLIFRPPCWVSGRNSLLHNALFHDGGQDDRPDNLMNSGSIAEFGLLGGPAAGISPALLTKLQ